MLKVFYFEKFYGDGAQRYDNFRSKRKNFGVEFFQGFFRYLASALDGFECLSDLGMFLQSHLISTLENHFFMGF